MRIAARHFAVVGLLSACGGGLEVARNVHADATAKVLPLVPSIDAPAGPRAVCLEFNPPGESRHVGELEFILTDASGMRDTIHGRVDRTGEAVVCLRDTVAVARSFVSLSVRAVRPLTVHRIVWSSPRDSIRATAP